MTEAAAAEAAGSKERELDDEEMKVSGLCFANGKMMMIYNSCYVM